jgi:hypothetical protein
MNYYQTIQQSLADSSLTNISLNWKFIGTFVQSGSNEIIPATFERSSIDYFSYILLFLITILAFIWSFLPERFLSVFNFSTKKGFSRSGEVTFTTPGLIITLFYFFNFIFSFGFFIFLLIKAFAPEIINSMNNLLFFAYILVAIIVFYLFRITYIKVFGFLFKTNEKSSQQLNIYMNTENSFGVLLIPFLFISLYTQTNFILFAGIFMFVLFLVIRWVKTFFIGMSIGGFSVLHLILYLCNLEIIPILVVIKLVENRGIN